MSDRKQSSSAIVLASASSRFGLPGENAREAAGLKGFQLRDLRHEAASRFEEAGVLTTDVSKFLGQRNLSTTTRYLNTTTRRLRLALLRVSRRGRRPTVLQILAKRLRNPARRRRRSVVHAEQVIAFLAT